MKFMNFRKKYLCKDAEVASPSGSRLSSIRKAGVSFLTLLALTVCSAFSVFASESSSGVSAGMTTVSSSLNNAFAEICTSLLNLVVQILPVVLPILGAITMVKFGIRVFKKVTAPAAS